MLYEGYLNLITGILSAVFFSKQMAESMGYMAKNAELETIDGDPGHMDIK